MSQAEKLIRRFCDKPKDFTYDELRAMLKSMGYEEVQGKGSGVKFIDRSTKHVINLHKPHPGNIIKGYLLDQIKDKLEEVGKL